MTGSYIELNYRLNTLFGPNEFIELVNLAIENIGFDEETQFDLVIQRNTDERLLLEVTPLTMGQHITLQSWPDIHQIIFSNHWIKGMNLKIQLVRRQEYFSLSVKCEMEDPDRRTQFINKLEEQLAKQLRVDTSSDASEQDRERLFGSILMTEPIIQATRQAFLAGDFRNVLAAATNLLNERIENLLKQRLKNAADVQEYFSQEPPRLIFPDLSGKQLHSELVGLGCLSAGILTLVKPIIQGKQPAPEDPARILKCLILISMLLERLEGAAPNPVAIAVQTKTVKKHLIKKKVQKKEVKKSSTLKLSIRKKKKLGQTKKRGSQISGAKVKGKAAAKLKRNNLPAKGKIKKTGVSKAKKR